MFIYNCIVTIYERQDGKDKPIHSFTMMKDSEMDVILKAVEWIADNCDLDKQKYYFDFEEVEPNYEEFTG
jgi:hypothetical protein